LASLYIERDGSILATVFRHGHPLGRDRAWIATGIQYLLHPDATISGFVD
jgi:hypothetical protein